MDALCKLRCLSLCLTICEVSVPHLQLSSSIVYFKCYSYCSCSLFTIIISYLISTRHNRMNLIITFIAPSKCLASDTRRYVHTVQGAKMK